MKTADPELMRSINRFNVLDTIRRHGPLSRVEISERTVLSPTTVSAITTALLDDKLILVHHEGDLRNSRTRGRPRVNLSINPAAASVVGVKICANRLTFVVVDFQGGVLATLTMPVRIDRQPNAVIADLVEDGVRRCVLDAGVMLSQIKTIALAFPGIVEHSTRRVRSSRIYVEGNVSTAATIQERLRIDTIAESHANAVALGQYWFGRGRDLDDFLVIALEEDLGLGVLHGGQLFRGARELSLTLGDMIVGAGDEKPITLSDLASDAAIFARAAGEPAMREALQVGRGMPQMRELIDAGNEALGEAVAQAGAAIGIAIGNLVGLFAPPRVILVGATLALGDHLLAPLRESFARAVPESLKSIAAIVIDEASDELWARGAAAVALSELYGSPWSTTGPARTAPGIESAATVSGR